MAALHLSKAALRLHFICAFFAIASFIWGYNVGILATIYVHPGFKAALHHPSPSQTGLITAIYYLGTWFSYIFLSHAASDRLGRKYAALVGVLVVCFGSALQAGASGSGAYAMMIVGRIFCGFGVAITSTSVPMYQSEVAPARQRGYLVVLNHMGFVAGLAIAFWVGYAVTFWDSRRGLSVGWRFSIALQYIPALIFCLGAPFVPETPRWLIQKNRVDEARKSLEYYREGSISSVEIEAELAEITREVEVHNTTSNSWTALFLQRNLFQRLWRAALLQFMAQMCGATAMKYYLPTLFEALGLSRRLSLLVGGIESTLKIGCTGLEMVVIDRFGRRVTLITGCIVMFIAMLINGALPLAYPHNSNHASDYTCVVFIFFFTFGYSLGFGPSSWVYGTEIFPTNFRARGLNFAASGGAIGSIIATQIWPVGVASIGSKTYFVFMAINLVCIPIIYLWYPETTGHTLEEMGALFGEAPLDRPTSSDGDEKPTVINQTVPAKDV